MPEPIELDPVDALAAGAIGAPGQRAFYLQARAEAVQVTVLVEKEQVALFAREAVRFLDQIAADYPDSKAGTPLRARPWGEAKLHEPTVPLFRARLIGIGFDPERSLVLIELREHGDHDEDDDAEPESPEVASSVEEADAEGWIARLYATPAQVRAMAARGAEAVAAGRPSCPLCDQPMDPAGHRCPRWN